MTSGEGFEDSALENVLQQETQPSSAAIKIGNFDDIRHKNTNTLQCPCKSGCADHWKISCPCIVYCKHTPRPGPRGSILHATRTHFRKLGTEPDAFLVKSDKNSREELMFGVVKVVILEGSQYPMHREKVMRYCNGIDTVFRLVY